MKGDVKEGNIDSLVIPLLLNLSSCALALGNNSQASKFAEQALILRSDCPRALYRKGIAALNLGNYREALESVWLRWHRKK